MIKKTKKLLTMFSEKTINSVRPEVAAVLRQINKDEATQNLSQARIGKRVPMHRGLEKTIGILPAMIVDKVLETTTMGAVCIIKVDLSQGEPEFSGKEPISFKRGKETNRYKVREAS